MGYKTLPITPDLGYYRLWRDCLYPFVHCGSGVTACHTLLALDYAEMPIPKLYIGSWSEWSRNNKIIEKTNT